MITGRTEQLLKLIAFGGVVTFTVFMLTNLMATYDFHIKFFQWIGSWSIRTKIEASVATTFFLIFGTWFALRTMKRGMSNVLTYDRG